MTPARKAFLLVLNYRPINWYGYLAIALLGYVWGVAEATYETSVNLIKVLLLVACYLAFSFGVNNCFDVEEDRAKGGWNPIAKGELGWWEAFISSTAIGLLGAVLTYFWFGWLAETIYLSMLALAYFYSAPPLRFKSRPYLDVATHVFFFGVMILVYSFSAASTDFLKLSVLVPFIVLLSTYAEINNHVKDYGYDVEGNVKTTVVVLGLKSSVKLMRVVALLVFASLIAVALSEGVELAVLMVLNTAIYLLLERGFKLTESREDVIAWDRFTEKFLVNGFLLLLLWKGASFFDYILSILSA